MTRLLDNQLSKLAREVSDIISELRLLIKSSSDSTVDKSKWVKFWEFLQPVLSTILPGLVLFFVGYIFLDRAKQDLEERQLATANVKEIRDLIKELLNKDLDAKAADSSALAIASFGRFAVVPLVTVLQAGGENGSLAAQKGIFAAALLDPSYTCDLLADVLNNRSRGFNWLTHKYVIELIGQIGCQGGKPREAIRDYEKLLGQGSTVYATTVDLSGMKADTIPMQDLRAAASEALSRVAASAKVANEYRAGTGDAEK